MQNKIISREMVYYCGEDEKKINLTGKENSLSVEERLEFLKTYSEMATSWYDDSDLDKKAVSQEETESLLKKVSSSAAETQIRSIINFDTMNAYAVQKQEKYKNIHCYCGAYFKNGEFIFPEKEVRPTPCVLYELESPKKEMTVSFKVYISESYRCVSDKRCGTAQGARIIELRSGTLDKVKLSLFNTGEITAMSEDMWDPVYTDVGNINFGEYNSFEIDVADSVTVTINGKTTENIKCTVDGEITEIFFDGGMFPRDEWRVAELIIDGVLIKLEKNISVKEIKEEIGEVKLPYAIGGVKNKDKQLYLEKSFYIKDFENAILDIESLDPCGKVWINGNLVLDTDSFMHHKIPVGKFLHKGENEIKIMVEPRAPEVYYFWHRHNDCYNGWFSGNVSIAFTSETYIDCVKVETKEVTPRVSATAKIKLNKKIKGKIKLCAKEIFPIEGEEIFLGEKEIHRKEIALSFENDLKLWEEKSPVIYEIRAVLKDESGKEIDDFAVETGFRTIRQKNGEVFLNDKKILLNGALLMQFLPPFDEVPINHNCPTDFQIAMQALALKNMNGNFLRLHILGYGTNDTRFARVCDRLGIMLAWTTRLIDSLEEIAWKWSWKEKAFFVKQIEDVVNHPSVIMYEGSNEYHARELPAVDAMYDEFTSEIKKVDKTRLLSPCSHLYYGGEIYNLGCSYYNDNGDKNQDKVPVKSEKGWKDPLVVRSAHTYSLLCGYGHPWYEMREQKWTEQAEMLKSKKHSYLITEFAVTALANPNTPEAKANVYVESYERPNELVILNRFFEQSEWRESQAYQAYCAFNAVKHMRNLGVDGMAWCCLMSGANNGSYLKPVIDFYGYKKLGYYALRDAYRETYACLEGVDVSYGKGDSLVPIILNTSEEGVYKLKIIVSDKNGNKVYETEYDNVSIENGKITYLPGFIPNWEEKGCYCIEFQLKK